MGRSAGAVLAANMPAFNPNPTKRGWVSVTGLAPRTHRVLAAHTAAVLTHLMLDHAAAENPDVELTITTSAANTLLLPRPRTRYPPAISRPGARPWRTGSFSSRVKIGLFVPVDARVREHDESIADLPGRCAAGRDRPATAGSRTRVSPPVKRMRPMTTDPHPQDDDVAQAITALTAAGYRTVPVRLAVDAEDVLDELGVAQLYWEARDAIDDEDAQDPSDDTAARLDAECAAVEALWMADLAAYAAAYAETASVAAHELGITTGVDITFGETDHEWDDLAVRLYEEARLRTPLPSSGIAPKDYANRDLAAAERAAGRSTYRERAAKGREGHPGR